MQLLGVADKFAIADLFLDGVQCLDLLQRFGGAGGFGRQRLEEAAAAVRPTSSMVDASLLSILFVGCMAVGQQHGINDRLDPQRVTNETSGP